MKHYAIRQSPTERFSAVVIATGTTPPQDELEQVAADLRRMHVRGEVVFDLLATNGTKARRFFAISFDGNRFPVSKFHKVQAEHSLQATSARFFCEHVDEVDLSLVSPTIRSAIARGVPL